LNVSPINDDDPKQEEQASYDSYQCMRTISAGTYQKHATTHGEKL